MLNGEIKMNCETGKLLWKKAKKLIPGGTQLLSKRSEMFLPNQWLSYYKKANNVEIWDLDDNILIDMTIMGVGAYTLGMQVKMLITQLNLVFSFKDKKC